MKIEGVTQFTYFDKYGPVGDFEAFTTEELANKIHEYGFKSCNKEDLKYTILSKKHENGMSRDKEEEIEL